jgi:PTH2 family peptidyl-tRNA hydrolase
MEYKQVIIVRNELKLPKGKLAAQVAHASVEATRKCTKSTLEEWYSQGMPKVVLKVETLKELEELLRSAQVNHIPCAKITDAGRTVVAPGTVTCIALGPAQDTLVDAVSAKLSLL